MKKITFFTFLFLSSFNFHAQTIDVATINSRLINLHEVETYNEDFTDFAAIKNLLKEVDIVMLGEQSHGEATTYQTKIKLIKYLHQEMGFDILAFESGFYECDKAWRDLQAGLKEKDARLTLGKGVTSIWSATKTMIPLTDYLEKNALSNKPLELMGFDNQPIGVHAEKTYLADLTSFLAKFDDSILKTKDWKEFSKFFKTYFEVYYTKKAKKLNGEKQVIYLQTLIDGLVKNPDYPRAQFWRQCLKNMQAFFSDVYLKTDLRDKMMAKNLIWLKEQNPGRKIICWGATSHFLYNAKEIAMKGFPYNIVDNYYQKVPMMGQYIKDKYGDRVHTIGFVSYEGEFGLFRKRKIKPAVENSLEYLLAQTDCDNCWLPLQGLTIAPLLSRPLGNAYMKNDIAKVMDSVIFNRKMTRPRLDKNFFLDLYPTNKYIKREEVQP